MEIKEVLIIILASIILGASFSAFETASAPITILYSIIFMFVIISLNTLAKMIVAYKLEADIKTEFWKLYQFGFRADSHFKNPLPMFWLPILLSLISKGMLPWLSILEFDVKPRVERASRRHGLYRFTEMTDFDVALIAASGVAINLILAIIVYLVAGVYGDSLARLSIYYAAFSLLPLSSLDGTKILFGSRPLWFTLVIITSIFLIISLSTF